MNKSQKMPWLKLVGWAFLTHIILFSLSYLEVFLYSILINPGQQQAVYEQHALVSAPYVAIILGIPLFYLVARWLAKGYAGLELQIGIWLAILYIILDLIILIPLQVDWSAHWWIFLLSFLTKLGAAYWGARSMVGVRKKMSV